MAEELKMELLSNSELRIKLIEYENEYSALSSKASDIVDKMNLLSEKYNKAKSILEKRTKGKEL